MNTERRFGTSTKGKLVNLREHLKPFADSSIVFAIGASPEGDPAKDTEYQDELVSISHYELSSACVCSKVVNAIGDIWGIL